jgi:hypothetical protein
MENQVQFVQFLIEAKKNTYAAGGKLSTPSRPGSKDLTFQRGDYTYIDTYLGDLDFIGEEAVWRQGKPLWGMNYYGVMLTGEIPQEFSHCLKGALSSVPSEAPFRGPASFRLGSLLYLCEWNGDVDRFQGSEQIRDNGKEIYRLVFHGGSLR